MSGIIHFDPRIPEVLPHGNMYKIQIGDRMFVISGASLSSDAPSYFTNYFLHSGSEDKPLFLDRSTTIFQYIYSHLQGYHLEIPNSEVFTKLYSDSIYFNLPRLKDLLTNDDYYYIEVSNEEIKIQKKLLKTEGNYPNFFNVTFESLYRDLSEVMISKKLIRPPPQASPKLNRDASLLKELIRLLQGTDIDIISRTHKEMLIKEARYYRFNAIVEKLSYEKILIPIDTLSKTESIVVDLRDVNLKDFHEVPIADLGLDEEFDLEPATKRQKMDDGVKTVFLYKRAHGVDDVARHLIIKIDGSNGGVLTDSPSAHVEGDEVVLDCCINFTQKIGAKLNKIMKKIIPEGSSVSINGSGYGELFTNHDDDIRTGLELKFECLVSEPIKLYKPKKYKMNINGKDLNKDASPVEYFKGIELSELLFKTSYWEFSVEKQATSSSTDYNVKVELLKADAFSVKTGNFYDGLLD